jgi:hypothetical protein
MATRWTEFVNRVPQDANTRSSLQLCSAPSRRFARSGHAFRVACGP